MLLNMAEAKIVEIQEVAERLRLEPQSLANLTYGLEFIERLATHTRNFINEERLANECN
jgi:hypothetical protein